MVDWPVCNWLLTHAIMINICSLHRLNAISGAYDEIRAELSLDFGSFNAIVKLGNYAVSLASAAIKEAD